MVRKAVIPAAGLGINFLPATKAQSKEMLPIIVTPTIQYVVEEAIDSGIDDILIIIGKGKRAIEDHFDRNHDLELYLENKKRDDQYNEIRRIADMANIHFIRQKEINGLGDAIRYAEQHVGNEPFAVLLGDTIIDSVIPVTQQLIDIYEQYRHTIVAVETVPKENVSRFGIVGGKQVSDALWSLTELVEKPSIDKTPSDLALAGRYILTPKIFKAIEDTPADKNNEIQLTDALQLMVQREDIYAYAIEGKRYDIGNKLDYLKTIVEIALKKDDISEEFLTFLKNIVSEKGHA
ncbi:MAG: UTP--glucose-1-phosphate uridylyltransferase GalU [Calditrichia bacterium]|jgi:UTP--glucose-1-phosphate uridylyltransferase|nr:UTP--glucose-1-phosphate uridylyltransferase GalU [Calditrichia bacterium]